jgi:hypothetical protein
MLKLFSTFSLVLLFCTVTFGQAAVDIPITVSNNAGQTSDIYFGLDLTATDGVDLALGEDALPGFPPGGYAAAWLFPDFVTLSYRDYRAPDPPPFPYTGHKSFMIKIQNDLTANPMTVSWNLPPEIAATSTITAGAQVVSFSGSFFIEFDYNPVSLQFITIEVDFENIGPPVVAPVFEISPTSLDFGPVGVGITSPVQTATVTNTGDAPLDIASVIPSDGQYAITPTTAIIDPGLNQIFDVTFTPAGLGTFPAEIEFTHNATPPTNILLVTGVGADAGPTFGVTPPDLNFGSVEVGFDHTLQLTVTNNGLSNTMDITSVIPPLPEYTVTPPTATILPGANQVFDVLFTPSGDATFAGDIEFVHNGTPSSDFVPVTGDGYVPAAVNGLVFEKDTVWNLEEDFYTETMQLLDVQPGPTIMKYLFFFIT